MSTQKINKHLASIVFAEVTQNQAGQHMLSVTHADGGGSSEVVGFGHSAERAARGQAIDIMARAKAERAKV